LGKHGLIYVKIPNIFHQFLKFLNLPSITNNDLPFLLLSLEISRHTFLSSAALTCRGSATLALANPVHGPVILLRRHCVSSHRSPRACLSCRG
jgi:hypothetical protein